LVLDDEAGRLIEWSASIRPAGLSGLAFDGEGNLFATTQPFSVPLPSLQGRKAASKVVIAPPDGTSLLLRLDPDTGAVLSSIGPFTEGEDGDELGLQDLTFAPATGSFYALSAGSFDRSLLRLDLSTRVATIVASDLPFNATGLAAG